MPDERCEIIGMGDSDDGGEISVSQFQERSSVESERSPVGLDAWADSKIIACSDGKSRRIPIEPSLFPMAPRVSGRVGLLRGAGGSIVPQVAAEFIKAYLEVTE